MIRTELYSEETASASELGSKIRKTQKREAGIRREGTGLKHN
jgi:hypothetical protein